MSALYSTAAAFIISAVGMLLIGDRMVERLRNKRWRKDEESWLEREDTPESHRAKRGTPSMGGIGIIAVAVVTSLVFSLSYNIVDYLYYSNAFGSVTSNTTKGLALFFAKSCILPAFVIAHALLGFGDDWSKATGRGGLRARAKFVIQVTLAIVVVLFWAWFVCCFLRSLGMLPEFPAWSGAQLAAVCMVLLLVVIGTGNAVNLTDGLDGLAAGLAVPAFLAVAAAYSILRPWFGDLPFAGAIAGACFGFLKFNKHKARVFMGDTGSLALGAALAIIALFSRAVFLLPFIAFIYYIEMFSVIIQVAYFKYTKGKTGEGKRIFRRAPLHHHFELGGWSEWRVVLTFWGINLATTLLGLGLWYAGILPRWP